MNEPCNCINAEKPAATDITADVEGYSTTLSFSTGETAYKPVFPVKVTYQTPTAKGDKMKSVRSRVSFIASFCPFCGSRLPVKEV